MKTKRCRLQFTELPTEYARLCAIAVPRPIHDGAGYQNALEIIEAMAGFESVFSVDQEDYFAVIADFVAAYENSQGGEKASRHPLHQPLGILKHLLDENGMGAADLSRLLGSDRTLGGKILRGERNLTVPHLRILADRFNVSPALFI